jgi:DNA invertase Pin-like site-specific DNA recombinase
VSEQVGYARMSTRAQALDALEILAEFGRELIRERTRAGIQVALARRGGRPRVMTSERHPVARTLRDAGWLTMSEIAWELGVGRSRLYALLAVRRAPDDAAGPSGHVGLGGLVHVGVGDHV